MASLRGLKARIDKRLNLYRLSPVARRVLENRLTYLSSTKLRNLEAICRQIAMEDVPGEIVEFGVALGGSAIILATLGARRPFVGFDLFGTIPPPGPNDGPDAHARYAQISAGKSKGIGGDLYYGYQDDLLAAAKASLATFGVLADDGRVRLVAGLFEDTIDEHCPTQVALAHIDCDWFAPVALCLDRTYAALSPGGFIVLDDYFDFSGCRDATDAFLANSDMKVVSRNGNLVLRRPGR